MYVVKRLTSKSITGNEYEYSTGDVKICGQAAARIHRYGLMAEGKHKRSL